MGGANGHKTDLGCTLHHQPGVALRQPGHRKLVRCERQGKPCLADIVISGG